MSGAHADIEAVFDYAPDLKLLAAAAKADDDDWNNDDGGHSGITDRTGHAQSLRSRVDSESESDIEERSDGGTESVGVLPIIARDTIGSPPPPDGILTSSPQRTRTLNTQITFERSPDRRRSLPGTMGDVPGPKRSGLGPGAGTSVEGQSVLQRLYGHQTQESNATGTRGGGWDANPPSWVLELNATLRGIEERQRHLEQILGGARSPATASAASIASDAEIDPL
jgi:hypothetical protein